MLKLQDPKYVYCIYANEHLLCIHERNQIKLDCSRFVPTRLFLRIYIVVLQTEETQGVLPTTYKY